MHSAVLRYIDYVARFGSIRRAAVALNVASSAVNRQILNLEAEVGTPLFERLGNGVRPTPAGDYVIRHARRTMLEWEGTLSSISALSGNISGEVRLLVISAATVRLLPTAIETLALAHPFISVRVSEVDPNDNAQQMRDALPDIAILFTDRRHRDYEIISRVPMKIGAIMRADHPLAGRSEVTLSECAAYPVALLDGPWALSTVAEGEFVKTGARFNAVVMTNSLLLTKKAMTAGLCIGFYTPTGFIDELRSGELVHVPLSEEELAGTEWGLFVHRSRATSPAIRAATRALNEGFEALRSDIGTLAVGKVHPRSRSPAASE